MRPVDQTKFGPEGNCTEACVASMLECGIDDVPDLGQCAGSWVAKLNKWLVGRGLFYVEIELGEGHHTRLPTGVVALISGQIPQWREHEPSKRCDFLQHAVVGASDGEWGWRVVHDPHPSRVKSCGLVRSFGLIVRLGFAGVANGAG